MTYSCHWNISTYPSRQCSAFSYYHTASVVILSKSKGFVFCKSESHWCTQMNKCNSCSLSKQKHLSSVILDSRALYWVFLKLLESKSGYIFTPVSSDLLRRLLLSVFVTLHSHIKLRWLELGKKCSLWWNLVVMRACVWFLKLILVDRNRTGPICWREGWMWAQIEHQDFVQWVLCWWTGDQGLAESGWMVWGGWTVWFLFLSY